MLRSFSPNQMSVFWWLGLFFLCSLPSFALFSASFVQAQPTLQDIQRTQRGGNFNPASTAWNGLSIFVSEAKQLGLRVKTPARWNWSQARIGIPLVIISPRDEELDTKPLKEFVHAGGRVFLADDFGAGDRLWKAFGLEGYRIPITPKAWKKQSYIDLHQTVPESDKEADFLLRQASFLFLNVPQWLLPIKKKSQPESLLISNAYKSTRPDSKLGGKVLWRISYGKGKLIVFSDPSALINQMIAYGDNHRFVRNVLRYLALPTQAKQIVLFWGSAEWQGTYQPKMSRGLGFSTKWWDALVSLNAMIVPLPALYQAYPPLWKPAQTRNQSARLSPSSWAAKQIELHRKYLGSRFLLFFTLLVCIIGTFLRFSSLWERSSGEKSAKNWLEFPHRFDEQVESYRDGSQSYLGPVIILKEELLLFLVKALDLGDQVKVSHSSEHPTDIGPIVIKRLRDKLKNGELPSSVSNALPQLERLISHIPSRHQYGSNEQRKIDEKSLKMYYNTAMLSLRMLGLEAEFRAFGKEPSRKQPHTHASTPQRSKKH